MISPKLLPKELHVEDGMQNLVTNSRLFGVVHVNTASETRGAADRKGAQKGEHLQIQVSRDRLMDNKAYRDLKYFVRWALDFYAMEQTKRVLRKSLAARPTEPVIKKFERVEDVLESHKASMPEPVYQTLRTQVRDSITASESEAESQVRQIGLLGSLATAGISALAQEHEAQKNLQQLKSISARLRKASGKTADARKLGGIADQRSCEKSVRSNLVTSERLGPLKKRVFLEVE